MGNWREFVELPEPLRDLSTISTLSHADSLLGNILHRARSLIKALGVTSIFLSCARKADQAKQRYGMNFIPRSQTVTLHESVVFLLKKSQIESFGSTLNHLQDGRTEGIASNDSLSSP